MTFRKLSLPLGHRPARLASNVLQEARIFWVSEESEEEVSALETRVTNAPAHHATRPYVTEHPVLVGFMELPIVRIFKLRKGVLQSCAWVSAVSAAIWGTRSHLSALAHSKTRPRRG